MELIIEVDKKYYEACGNTKNCKRCESYEKEVRNSGT